MIVYSFKPTNDESYSVALPPHRTNGLVFSGEFIAAPAFKTLVWYKYSYQSFVACWQRFAFLPLCLDSKTFLYGVSVHSGKLLLRGFKIRAVFLCIIVIWVL